MQMVPGHAAFCLRLVAQDSSGAETTADKLVVPENRRPNVLVDVAEPTTAPPYPIFTLFRLSCERTADPDGDSIVSYRWEVRDPAGMPVAPEACPGVAAVPHLTCFHAPTTGTFTVTATANDGFEEGRSAPLSLAVGEDQPPCIELTDPPVELTTVVLGATDPPRRFEVRKVRDDGNPFPPVGSRATSFRWYIASATATWSRQIGYEGATLDVSAGRFEDARPGSVYRVRVEARDPAHDTDATRLDLESCTNNDERVCQSPPGCVRWVGWKVQLQ
jgi:hypothetical protein